MTIRVTMIRHGKTRGNMMGAYIGSIDELLCEEGRAEITKRQYPKVERVYASPMLRCVETARLIYPRIEPVLVPELRECHFGIFEGASYQTLKENPAYQAWLNSGGTVPFPEGEDPDLFKSRCIKGFLELCASQQEDAVIAVVCHGGTIMAVMECIGRPPQSFYSWQVKNGGGFTFDFNTVKAAARDIRRLD